MKTAEASFRFSIPLSLLVARGIYPGHQHLTRINGDSGDRKRQRGRLRIRQQQDRAAEANGDDNEQIVPRETRLG